MKKAVIFFAAISFFLYFCSSCKTTQYIPIETVRTEYRNKINTDSIFLRDSIFVKEKGDTFIMEKYRYFYRDRILRDSVFLRDTLRVPYPVEVVKETQKPLSNWQNFQVWCGRIALVMFLFVIMYFVLKSNKKR
jgi:hypothetical protein